MRAEESASEAPRCGARLMLCPQAPGAAESDATRSTKASVCSLQAQHRQLEG